MAPAGRPERHVRAERLLELGPRSRRPIDGPFAMVLTRAMAENEAMTEQRERIGIREVFAGVNLRDFFDMVKGEFGLLLTAARAAVRAHPALIPFALVLVVLRLILLVGVVIVLGGAITTVMVLRGVLKMRHESRRAPPEEESNEP